MYVFIKLIPTMVIAVLYNRKKVQPFEFGFGSLISVGMILFAVADFQVYPKFDMIGSFDNCFGLGLFRNIIFLFIFICIFTSLLIDRHRIGLYQCCSRCLSSEFPRTRFRSWF